MFPPYHVPPFPDPASSQETASLPSQPSGGSPFSISRSVRVAVQKLTALGDLLERAQAEDAEGALVLLASQSELWWLRKEMPWSPVLEHGLDPTLFGFVIPQTTPFQATLVERAKGGGTPRLLSLLQGTAILPPNVFPMQAIPPLAALLPYLRQSGGAFVGGVFLPSSVVRLLDQDASLLAALQGLGQGML